jgi:hypothetical protein
MIETKLKQFKWLDKQWEEYLSNFRDDEDNLAEM